MIKKIASISLFLVSFSACGYVSYLRDPFVDIPQFVQVDQRIYRGGKPTADGLAKLVDLGVQTVISFQGSSEKQAQESVRVEALGMNYKHIPLSVYEEPSDAAVMDFIETVLDPASQPVFVHCHSGRDRTGVMIAIYRVLVDEWSIKEAYKEAKKYGFWPYKGDAVLKNFLHRLKDKEHYFSHTADLKQKYAIDS
jgi:protein tyrosine/serine phosphatase